jgi:hypothetical protein
LRVFSVFAPLQRKVFSEFGSSWPLFAVDQPAQA